jgi:hypothetical protein
LSDADYVRESLTQTYRESLKVLLASANVTFGDRLEVRRVILVNDMPEAAQVGNADPKPPEVPRSKDALVESLGLLQTMPGRGGTLLQEYLSGLHTRPEHAMWIGMKDFKTAFPGVTPTNFPIEARDLFAFWHVNKSKVFDGGVSSSVEPLRPYMLVKWFSRSHFENLPHIEATHERFVDYVTSHGKPLQALVP